MLGSIAQLVCCSSLGGGAGGRSKDKMRKDSGTSWGTANDFN